MQIMSMGNGLWPLMMLPAATTAHHMNPQLGMGFRPPQLPIPPSLSAITYSRQHISNRIPHLTHTSITQQHITSHNDHYPSIMQ